MTPTNEFATKRDRVAAWLEERGADAVLLASSPNLCWLGSGGELARLTVPSVGFVVSRDKSWLLCPGDDADRVRQEELRGQGVDIVPLSWLGPEALVERGRSLLPESARWKSDLAGLSLEHDPSVDLFRRTLLPEEQERLRKLGRDAAAAVEDVATECYRGILERDAAARLAAECVRRQIVPRLLLAGADERLQNYARPLPKNGSAEQVLLLALVGMRGGLHVALSRIVCLARPDGALLERFAAACEIVTQLRHEARPNESLGAAVQRALPHPALHLGSLGGLTSYEFPEVEARPSSGWKLGPGQACVWSAAFPGARCEDTHLLGAGGTELVTATEGWPRRTVHVANAAYEVPDLLLL